VAAAFTLTYATSHLALFDRGQLKPGETLAVLGAGGVSAWRPSNWARSRARVIAVASSEEKLDAAREHGADVAINYVTGDLREELKAHEWPGRRCRL